MIAEVDPKGTFSALYGEIAQVVTGRGQVQRAKKSPFAPILERLRRKKT